MAKSSDDKVAVLHSWVTPKFAREVREFADSDGRSVSNLIRVMLRDRITEPSSGEDAAAGGRTEEPKAKSPSAGASAPTVEGRS